MEKTDYKKEFKELYSASKKKDNQLLVNVKFEQFKEGKAVQIMQVGPYNTVSFSINIVFG